MTSPMITDTPAAAPITAERELMQRAWDWMADNETVVFAASESAWKQMTLIASDLRARLSAPVQPAASGAVVAHGLNTTPVVDQKPLNLSDNASGVDALWVHRLRETAAHLRGNSLSLAKYPGMADEARARELAALYIGEIAELYALHAHLSTALTGAAKE